MTSAPGDVSILAACSTCWPSVALPCTILHFSLYDGSSSVRAQALWALLR